MRKLINASLAAATFLLSGSMTTAFAQDTKTDKGTAQVNTNTIAENDKVRAREVTYPPGAQNSAVPSKTVRVVRVLEGGKIQRTYADGKKEDIVWKTGEVKINEPSPSAYTARNVGSTTIKLFVVEVK